MEITWYGYACFRLRDRGIAIITDPYDQSLGYRLPRLRGDIVTVSHNHPTHNFVKGVRGYRKVLEGPGEYEVQGVFVSGIATYHDDKKGAKSGGNTLFLFEFDDVSICHLGSLGHPLTQAQTEMLTDVSVLLVPVGGGSTLDAARASEVISQVEPRIVVPMRYHTPGLAVKLDPIGKFLKEMGLPQPEAVSSLKVTAQSLPQDTQVVLMEPATAADEG
ncbi:MAG: MBL fold metallo-hydrolase [Chloroflexi bacterium]|nr:MBL fold metallo-hydrolase [Chloroflexota bacterium]